MPGSKDDKQRSGDGGGEEKPREENTPDKTPPAGPHAREDLVDRQKTPGTGSLPDPEGGDADVGPD
jgi:hypothetical protein